MKMTMRTTTLMTRMRATPVQMTMTTPVQILEIVMGVMETGMVMTMMDQETVVRNSVCLMQ